MGANNESAVPDQQAIGVDSPSTEDVEGWGLTGEGAEQLGILIRWLKNQLVIYERAREESRAPPRYTRRSTSIVGSSVVVLLVSFVGRTYLRMHYQY